MGKGVKKEEEEWTPMSWGPLPTIPAVLLKVAE